MSASSSTPSSSATIKTRFLIISDTHNAKPQTKDDNPWDTEDELSTKKGLSMAATGYREPLAEADVVLHCGDLTKRGHPPEFQRAFEVLRRMRAPLKLVIGGNHDSALDERFYLDKVGAHPSEYAEVCQTIKEAEQDGVKYLTEGTHTFDLANGARLRIFVSQFTPKFGYWAFQYYHGEHVFDIPPGVDIAMTHGPALGVLDVTGQGVNAGCSTLFKSIYRAKPKIHCFGHIHEGWGAYLAQWKPNPDDEHGGRPTAEDTVAQPGILSQIQSTLGAYIPQLKDKSTDQKDNRPIVRDTVIDGSKSRLIQNLKDFKPKPSEEEMSVAEEKHKRLIRMSKQRGFHIDLTEGENQLREGEQTLFVNAAIMDHSYRPTHMPWLVDVNLPRAD